MEHRPVSVWWYVLLGWRILLALVAVVGAFGLSRHFWGDHVAVLLSLAALTMSSCRVVLIATLRLRGASDREHWSMLIRRLYLSQGIVASVLLLISVILELLWLAGAFALWAVVSFLISDVASRRAPPEVAGEPAETAERLRVLVRRRISRIVVASIPASATIEILFAKRIISFWVLLALVFLLCLTLGLTSVFVFVSSYRKASRNS